MRSPGILTFLRWEWTLQKRTIRFWISLLAYLVLVLLPALAIYSFGERAFGSHAGPTTFLVWTMQVQTFLGVLLACTWSGNRSGSVATEELWPVLQASPLSNAGFELRRSLAIGLLLLPATAAATVAAAAISHLYGEPLAADQVVQWLVTWFLLAYLPAAIFGAAWRTLVRATGGEMLAALSLLLLFQGFGFVRSKLISYVGWPFGLDSEAFGHTGFQWATFFLTRVQGERRYFTGGTASEAPFDPAAAIRQWWLVDGVTLGLALALALLVPLWMKRTRRDLPPLRLSKEHWLRTTVPKTYGFLQRLVPDAGVREAKWLAAGVVLLVTVLAADDWRHQADALELAQRRYAAEVSGGELAPTDSELRLVRWQVRGDVDPQGVDLEWRSDFRLDEGAGAPAHHVAFTLDPQLEVAELRLDREAGERGFSVAFQDRRWDRWIVGFEPGLEPGETVRLSARFRGMPGDLDLGLHAPSRESGSFVTLFEGYLRHGDAWTRSDLSQAEFTPAVSPRSVHLPASSLGAVPRYTTWQLTDPPVLPTDRGNEVPQESGNTRARVELDLTLSAGAPGALPLLAASSCGGVAEPAADGGSAHLVDSCDTEVHRLRVMGGRWQRRADGPVAVAALARDVERLASALPEMRTVIAASAEAWPGFDGIERLAVVEISDDYDVFGRDLLMFDSGWNAPQANGRMVLYGESELTGAFPLQPTAVLDGVLTAELTSRRRFDLDQSSALRAFLGALMKRRMGVGQDTAVVGKDLKPWEQAQLRMALVSARRWHGVFLHQKVPALVIELEQRVGRVRLVEAVAKFLSEDAENLATVGDLFDTIRRETGADLDAFVHDFVQRGGLPKLALQDVRSLSGRAGWRVEGAVANRGVGEVHCPVVVRSEGAEVRQTVVVPSEGQVAFAFDLATRPQFVVLDPEGLCLRLHGGGGAGAERVNLIR